MNKFFKIIKCSSALKTAVVWLIVVLVAPTVDAQQQYFKSWTTREGLPQINVTGIAQTPDGYLWVATVDGLARFDGLRFKVFNKSNTPEIPNNRIHNIFTDTNGRLWATYPNDDTVLLYENGVFKSFEKGRDFEKDENDDPTIGGYKERFRYLLRRPEIKFRAGELEYVYEDGRFVSRPAAPNRNFPSRVFATDNKSVWIDEPDALYHVADERVTRYGKDAPLPIDPGQTYPVDSAERDGTLWFASFYSNLVKMGKLCSFKDGKLKVFPSVRYIDSLEFDEKGNLWLAIAGASVYKVDSPTIALNDPANFPVKDDLPKKGSIFFRDRDKNIWFGGASGLHLIKSDPAVIVYGRDTGLPADNVYPIVQDAEGTIWFGAWADTLINFRDDKFSFQRDYNLTSLFVDSKSRLWKGNGDLIEYRENDEWEMVLFKNILPPPWNTATSTLADLAFIAEDKEGSMWFGHEIGLIRYAPGGSRIFTANDGLPSNVITSYLFTRAGEMWIGTNNGIARLEAGRFRAFTEKDGLAGNYTRSFYEDEEGTIWIGSYDAGVTRLKNGEFKKITMRDGLFSDGVFVILEDDAGWFWMNSNQGIYRVQRDELNDFADGRIESVTSVSYGPEDGLLNVEGNGGKQPAGLRAKDGKLWFPMAKGVAVIDPKTVKRTPPPPPVLIEEVRIDQKTVTVAPAQIRINPDQVAFEIDYTALGFTGADRMRFRYRIEGLDASWTEAGARRTAYFSHLPYGEYTFRVIAANYDGVWNTEGAAVRIAIVAPFYREWWFYAVAILGALVAVACVYRYRLRHLQALDGVRSSFTRKLIESQEGERRRIALELHDSLGQMLAVIRNRTLIGLNIKDAEKIHEQLREISETSSVALRETREIAHNLHPAQIENLGLKTALESLVKSVGNATGLGCEMDICEAPPNLAYDVSINIYRIAQESLSNIIKHSDASLAVVNLRIRSNTLVLTIKDDGRGFSGGVSSSGLGLRGMQERSTLIGGELTVDSRPGEGTKVRLALNLG